MYVSYILRQALPEPTRSELGLNGRTPASYAYLVDSAECAKIDDEKDFQVCICLSCAFIGILFSYSFQLTPLLTARPGHGSSNA